MNKVINIINNKHINKNILYDFVIKSGIKLKYSPNRYSINYLKNLLMKKYKINKKDLVKNNKNKLKYDYCFHLIQGRRDYMEDNITFIKNNNIQFSSIYDGHGGKECSLFLKKYLYKYFCLEFNKNISIKRCFINSYKKIHKSFYYKKIKSGSTCNSMFINKKKNKYYIANVGDSRAILCSNKNTIKQITKDHKPNNSYEKKLIYSKGGFVKDNRVDGILAMSRSIGDRSLSEHLSQIPDIYTGSTKNIKFIVQASDGLYDVLSNTEICNFINNSLKKKINKKDIAKLLVNYAYKKGSYDNISVIITYIH